MKKNKITMSEIGRMAGVSQATVSRAINQPHMVKEELREKIQYFIDKYKFVPDESAKTMRGVGSKILGLIVFSFSNYYYLEMAKYAEKIAREKGYSLLIMNSEKNSNLEKEHIKMMLARKVEGILIAPVDEKNLDFLNSLDIAFVAINNDYPRFNSVYTSLFKGGELVGEYLLELGHKKIGYIGDNRTRYNAKFEGLKNILKKANINFKKEWFYNIDSEKISIDNLNLFSINQKIECTAFMCSNDEVAYLAIKKLELLGYKIPNDISIVGFDNTIVANLLNITSISQPTELMIENAIDILLEKDEKIKNIFLIPKIVKRKSTIK
ncbi:LacI family DNA-binding transcriptional regulator [uncultured Cetobacterium sp.]|uniref:LacI family DNA-binding transcriptional regulator n=1 Tax=uncultured Cetobacterium sp. TaxID=527638 RepID=UPI00260A0AED|nr:LacI family DNA-binding transcriptional regulator [uncultured Cetobacterium sp.]